IKFNLVTAVAGFTNCEGWKSKRENCFVFCGLPSDADLASWMLDSLTAFVLNALAEHFIHDQSRGHQRRRVINGFIEGACNRIAERVDELRKQSAAQQSSNSKALIIIKNQAAKDLMKELGIKVRSVCTNHVTDSGAYAAGKQAGNRATSVARYPARPCY